MSCLGCPAKKLQAGLEEAQRDRTRANEARDGEVMRLGELLLAVDQHRAAAGEQPNPYDLELYAIAQKVGTEPFGEVQEPRLTAPSSTKGES